MVEEKTKEKGKEEKKEKEKEKEKPAKAAAAPKADAPAAEGAEATTAAAPAVAAVKKKKIKRNIPVGIVKIQATFNNTIISITDTAGNVVVWTSAGSVGFKGSRKSTPFAAQLAAGEAAKRALDSGMNSVSVFVNGPGAGRESAIRAIQGTGLKVSFLKDITPVPHNGCRPKKRRRI